MTDKEYDGKLVFLTVHVDKWLREVNSEFNIPMANRLAKVIKVFNWKTEEGKLLLQHREKTGKWKKLKPQDFKFVLKIYHPDLITKTKSGEDKKGFTAEEVLPRYFPDSKLTLFETVPDWMLKDFRKIENDMFQLVDKKKVAKKKVAKKKVVKKKKTAKRNASK